MSSELRRARNRQMIIFLLVCLGMTLLLGKLYYWQVLQSHDGYHLADLANAEHIQNQIVDAPRGLIYDANGHLLATNVVRDDVYIEPLQFATDHPDNYQADLAAQVRVLHQVLPAVSEDRLKSAFNANLQTVRIAGPVEPAQSERLRTLHLPDTFLEPRTWRIYPAGDMTGQLLGYVRDGKGVYGIEGKYNKLLSGKAGSFTAETDLNGNPLIVGASSEQDAVKGADIALTIDSAIQYTVQTALTETVKKMQAESGTVVVLNARTGAVVAMAGEPTFDPNNYSVFANKVGCLGTEQVYFNPALYCTYEPGSTMKAITMAIALDQKIITPDTTINDPGYLTFRDGTPTVFNWNHQGYGTETMTGVLQHSANVGAAYVATTLGPERYYPYLQRFGFGTSTGLFGPEDPGFYRNNLSADWTMSDLTRQSFGQSIRATPLQVALAYQAIANDGVLMRPYLLAAVNENGHTLATQPQVQRRVISSEAAKLLAGMLTSAANYNKIATLPGYSVAVKTGTATTQGIAEDQTEASMAGFLPASNPQFVILVKIDRPQANIYGGPAAGPLWKSIAQQLMWHYHVPPDLSQ